jgi:transposase
MSEPATEPDVYLGIDVGKTFHHAVALGRGGEVLLDEQLPNDETEIREVIAALRKHGSVLLVVDQPSDVGAFPVAVARSEGVSVAYLPGIAMRRIADLHVGQSKSDRRDALVIAHAARSLPHALRSISGEADSIAELRVLCAFDDDLATEINQASNRYRALLAKVHPALERAIGPRLAHPAMLDLLQDYASPEALRSAGHERIEARLLIRAPRIGSQMANDIELALGEQTIVIPGTRASASVLVRLAGQLQLLRHQREDIAEHIAWLVQSHPLYLIVASMPGVGIGTSARILTEIVPRHFESAAHLAAFAGLAPVSRRSGTSINRQHRSVRGHRALKRALLMSAFAACSHDEASRAYYDRKRREGKRHRQALAALARRRLDVLYAMLRDGRPYRSTPDSAPDDSTVPPIRRAHRTMRARTEAVATAPRPAPPGFYDWIVERLGADGSFHCRVDDLPWDAVEFRGGLRQATDREGLRIATKCLNGRFTAEVVDFYPSETSMEALAERMVECVPPAAWGFLVR